jgi:hypothetical protein
MLTWLLCVALAQEGWREAARPGRLLDSAIDANGYPVLALNRDDSVVIDQWNGEHWQTTVLDDVFNIGMAIDPEGVVWTAWVDNHTLHISSLTATSSPHFTTEVPERSEVVALRASASIEALLVIAGDSVPLIVTWNGTELATKQLHSMEPHEIRTVHAGPGETLWIGTRADNRWKPRTETYPARQLPRRVIRNYEVPTPTRTRKRWRWCRWPRLNCRRPQTLTLQPHLQHIGGHMGNEFNVLRIHRGWRSLSEDGRPLHVPYSYSGSENGWNLEHPIVVIDTSPSPSILQWDGHQWWGLGGTPEPTPHLGNPLLESTRPHFTNDKLVWFEAPNAAGLAFVSARRKNGDWTIATSQQVHPPAVCFDGFYRGFQLASLYPTSFGNDGTWTFNRLCGGSFDYIWGSDSTQYETRNPNHPATQLNMRDSAPFVHGSHGELQTATIDGVLTESGASFLDTPLVTSMYNKSAAMDSDVVAFHDYSGTVSVFTMNETWTPLPTQNILSHHTRVVVDVRRHGQDILLMASTRMDESPSTYVSLWKGERWHRSPTLAEHANRAYIAPDATPCVSTTGDIGAFCLVNNTWIPLAISKGMPFPPVIGWLNNEVCVASEHHGDAWLPQIDARCTHWALPSSAESSTAAP